VVVKEANGFVDRPLEGRTGQTSMPPNPKDVLQIWTDLRHFFPSPCRGGGSIQFLS
jgi:hypothetical protein